MSETSLRRADEVLTELVELVETARSVPISGSCVIPREHTLDLLDDLREVLPPEVAQARQVVAERDSVLADGQAHAARLVTEAREEAERVTSAAAVTAAAHTESARQFADTLVAEARSSAAEMIAQGEIENARLISSAGVHQAASEAAARLSAQADAYADSTRAAALADAERVQSEAAVYDAQLRKEAEEYARALRQNVDDYADSTLGEITMTLHRAAATAERGRAELVARRSQSFQAEPSQAESSEAESSHAEPSVGVRSVVAGGDLFDREAGS